MSADWRTQTEKDEAKAKAKKRQQAKGTPPWGSWVRKTRAPIWRRFTGWNENCAILWNMDANDEVRDHLKGYAADFYINSDWFKGYEDVFTASFGCPWRMRDLYQYVVRLYQALRKCEPLERYRHFNEELGYLEAADGQRFDFGFLLPEDLAFEFAVRPADVDEWNRQVEESEKVPWDVEEESEFVPMTDEELEWFAETMDSADRTWKDYQHGKIGGGFKLEGQEVFRKN